MTVELNMVGVKCNLSCTYCYENPMREAGNFSRRLDLEAAKRSLEKQGSNFSLFGGEPLLSGIDVLEDVFKFGLERFGQSGVQTNGALITDAHIELFAKYKVHVGISVDGPGELNAARCGVAETERTLLAINKLLNCGRKGCVSLIITLSKHNASRDKIEELCNWLRSLDAAGLENARIHLLEPDNCDEIIVEEEELFESLLKLESLEKELTVLKLDLFTEIKNALSQTGDKSCVWTGCDPFTTPAVQSVEADGSLGNCGRVNKDGVNWVKAEKPGNERLYALWNGDCSGCKYFIACRGYCPGTANGDWRRKTVHCGILYKLFSRFENENSVLATPEEVKKLFLRNSGNSVNYHNNIVHQDHTNVSVGRPKGLEGEAKCATK